MDYRGGNHLNGRLGLLTAVCLQFKVRRRGLGLRPRSALWWQLCWCSNLGTI